MEWIIGALIYFAVVLVLAYCFGWASDTKPDMVDLGFAVAWPLAILLFLVWKALMLGHAQRTKSLEQMDRWWKDGERQ